MTERHSTNVAELSAAFEQYREQIRRYVQTLARSPAEA